MADSNLPRSSALSAERKAAGGDTASSAPTADALLALWTKQMGEPLRPGLHVVATPIGNLADTSLRALATLAKADEVLCEDTRHSRKLLAHFGLRPRLRVYDDHASEAQREAALDAAERGAVALISDAGTPLVSDPGFKLVRAAVARGITVWAVPGPSAAIAALSIAGLPTDRFHFEGFLSAKTTARRNRLQELAHWPATLLFYEAPNRVAALMTDMATVMPGRSAVVTRELTKLYEEVVRGSTEELAAWGADAVVRGEVAVLVGPPDVATADASEIDAMLRRARESMSVRDAAKLVADATGAPKKDIYQRALTLDRDGAD